MDRVRGTLSTAILRCTCSGTLNTFSYNVPNDRTIAPSAGVIRNKQQTTGAGRQWLLASLQSAQSGYSNTSSAACACDTVIVAFRANMMRSGDGWF